MTGNNAVNTSLSGQTGTGSFVGSASPTFTGTPILATASATTLNISSAAGLTINSLKPVVTVKEQAFMASGTYTPSTGMLFCQVTVVGPGGGSGGCAANGASNLSSSGGGGGGGVSISIFTSSAIGASQTITIGSQGSAGSSGNNNGGNAGNTVFGSLLTATGGSGGAGGASLSTSTQGGGGGTGGSSVLGFLNFTGQSGGSALNVIGAGSFAKGGDGGGSPFATGTIAGVISAASPGVNVGSGAAGGSVGNSGSAIAGAAGNTGFVYIIEYCNQ